MNGGRQLAVTGAQREVTRSPHLARRRTGCCNVAMAIHPGVEAGDARLEVVQSLRPRLSDVAADADVERLIGEAFDELTPAKVTTFLPILVERKVRDRLRHRAVNVPPA